MCSYGITEVPLTGPPSQTTPLCVCVLCVCVCHHPETMHARFNCLQALDPPSPRKLWLWLVDLLNRAAFSALDLGRGAVHPSPSTKARLYWARGRWPTRRGRRRPPVEAGHWCLNDKPNSGAKLTLGASAVSAAARKRLTCWRTTTLKNSGAGAVK